MLGRLLWLAAVTVPSAVGWAAIVASIVVASSLFGIVFVGIALLAPVTLGGIVAVVGRYTDAWRPNTTERRSLPDTSSRRLSA
jgi:hypothetical protein